MFVQGRNVKLEPSEIAKVSATIAKNFFDLISPHLVIQKPRSLYHKAAELQILQDKIQKTPFGHKKNKLVAERTKWYDELGNDALKIKKEAEKSGFLKKIQSKISMPLKAIRIIGVIIAIAYISFLIWDLAVHGGQMSGAQLALNIINLILEVAVVVCEIVSIALPALNIVPVIGQVFAILLLIVSILLSIFSSTEHQKTPGEKFVDRMQAPGGWLSTLPDPPSALLTTTMTPEAGTKGAPTTFTFTLTNSTPQPIKFSEATKDIPGTPASSDTINSVEINFFGGSDSSALFSNVAFAGPSEAAPPPLGSGSWSVTTPGTGPASAWKVDLQKPNGSNLQSTGFQLRIKTAEGAAPVIARGEKFVVTIKGGLGGEAGTALVKVVEKRPGAQFCPTTFLVTRN